MGTSDYSYHECDMKDSGEEWLGCIPASWNLMQLKHLVSVTSEKTSEFTSYLGLENVESWSGRYMVTETQPSDQQSIAIREGDLCFSKLRPYLAKVILSPFDGACSSEFIVINGFKGDLRYLKYLMLSPTFIENVNSNTYGTKMPRANWDYIGSILVPEIPLDDQISIANYLDNRCSTIDELIAYQDEIISQLRDLKQSIITEAVTKGLDPNALMKDSDLVWTDNLPSHWSVSKIKAVCRFNPRLNISIEQFDRVGYVPMECLGKGIVTPSSISTTEMPTGLNYFEDGDIIMAKVTPCFENGDIAIVDGLENGIGVGSSELFVFRTDDDHRRYLYYLLQVEPIKQVCASTMTGVAGLKRVSPSFIRNLNIPVPPISEMKEITDYLDRYCSVLDATIALCGELIGVLQQYKSSIIFEYVTGKKSVNGEGSNC